MFKKLLTLSLVALMLSTVALTSNGVVDFGVATYAEEAEVIKKTIQATTETAVPFELLRVTQNATTGAQSISTPALTSSGSNPTYDPATQWFLARINVGATNPNFTVVKFAAAIQIQPGRADLYVEPLAYTDYQAALDAKAAGTTLTNLVQPTVNSTATTTPGFLTRTSSGNQGTSYAVLDASLFNGTAYHDGYLYLALAFVKNADNPTGKIQPHLKLDSKRPSWKLYVEYTEVETPAVTDFSDAVIAWDNRTCTVSNIPATGTAMLIAASFNGTTMVDAQVASIDAATDAENGVITETFTDLEAGEKVRVFLWDPTTLAPAIEVAEF